MLSAQLSRLNARAERASEKGRGVTSSGRSASGGRICLEARGRGAYNRGCRRLTATTELPQPPKSGGLIDFDPTSGPVGDGPERVARRRPRRPFVLSPGGGPDRTAGGKRYAQHRPTTGRGP